MRMVGRWFCSRRWNSWKTGKIDCCRSRRDKVLDFSSSLGENRQVDVWEMNMWTEFLPKSVRSSWLPFIRKIHCPNWLSVDLCTVWAIVTDCTQKICRDARISYFPGVERSSSFTDAFGIVIRGVGIPRLPSLTSTSGSRNSKKTWLATGASAAN